MSHLGPILGVSIGVENVLEVIESEPGGPIRFLGTKGHINIESGLGELNDEKEDEVARARGLGPIEDFH